MNPTPSDEVLMNRFKKGDRDALGEIYRRFGTSIYKLVLKRTGDHHLSLDVVQQTFVRILEHRQSYRDDGKVSSWIFCIALNLMRDAQKYANRRPKNAYGIDNQDGSEVPMTTLMGKSSEPDPADTINQQEQVTKLIHEIKLLAELDQQTVALWLQGYTPVTMAKVWGIPHNTAKTRVKGAMDHLRVRFGIEPHCQSRRAKFAVA